MKPKRLDLGDPGHGQPPGSRVGLRKRLSLRLYLGRVGVFDVVHQVVEFVLLVGGNASSASAVETPDEEHSPDGKDQHDDHDGAGDSVCVLIVCGNMCMRICV